MPDDYDVELANNIIYDPWTGDFFRTLRSGYRRGMPVKAGYVNSRGYFVIRFKNRVIQAHRVAWFIYYGLWPGGIIDHANGDKLDNRIGNLRIATPTQNNANMKAKGNKLKGSTFIRRIGKWQAQVKCDGKTHYLGLFDSEADAHKAYIRAATKLFGSFARPA
ncbi:HNH endonuclease [Xanthobacter dioxanivorans]|nr:HNH endonuclease [Xanthobacter dioxanivorans]